MHRTFMSRRQYAECLHVLYTSRIRYLQIPAE